VDWLSDDEIRQSFNRRAAVLDEAVSRAGAKLALDAVRVIDRSNRTGVGKGLTDFSYCVELEDRCDDGPVSVARVTLSFYEPPALDVGPPVIKVSWLAEQFWPSSSTSLLKVTGGHKWDGAALPLVDEITAVLVSMMSEARRVVGRTDATA
jgi:hypothetical protein